MRPAQRTLKSLREDGYIADMVERFLKYAGKFGQRKDLFGLFDILAIKADVGIIGVQCFGGSEWTTHYNLLEERRDTAITWLQAGGQIEFWGWRKLKKYRGSKQVLWTPRIETFDLSFFQE